MQPETTEEPYAYIRLKDYHIYALGGYFYCFHHLELSKFIVNVKRESGIKDEVIYRNLCYNIGLILTLLDHFGASFIDNMDVLNYWTKMLFQMQGSGENDLIREALLFLTHFSEFIGYSGNNDIDYLKVKNIDLLRYIMLCGALSGYLL